MRPFRPDRVPRPILPEFVLQTIEAGLDDLEIGAGQGLHAIRYSLANPKRTILAVERTAEKFERFKGRFQRHAGLSNLCPVHADAVSVVTHFIREESLSRVFLLYPNPYPKKKQANLRWHNSPFMECLVGKIKKGGRLYLSTNLQWYADEAKLMFQKHWRMTLASEAMIFDCQLAQTHFERKYLRRGETCIRQIFIKS